jgi:hypothetical protein
LRGVRWNDGFGVTFAVPREPTFNEEKEMFEKFIVAIVAVFAIFVTYVVVAVMPVILYAEAECMRNGYPMAHVTIGLERYCSTLDGSVTVKVTKQ